MALHRTAEQTFFKRWAELKTFQSLCVMLCVGLGFGYNSNDIFASEPSPLGKDRVLALCFLEKSNNEILTQFYDDLIWNEFSERQLTIIEISKQLVQSVRLHKGGDVEGVINRTRHHDFGEQLRRKADCKKDFEFVLIGKDTGVKKRWQGLVPQGELFQLIDAMPMRRYEMRQQKDKN